MCVEGNGVLRETAVFIIYFSECKKAKEEMHLKSENWQRSSEIQWQFRIEFRCAKISTLVINIWQTLQRR